MANRKITTWLQVYMGFRQETEWETGSDQIWSDAREYADAYTNIELSRWNSCAVNTAELFRRSAAKDCKVILAAYSWGFGCGAVALAKEFRKRGIRVHHLIGCDPVYHSRAALWRAMWSPILGEPVIRIPDNVDSVEYWTQKQNKPAGHKLLPMSGHTALKYHGDLPRTHEFMDESPEYHQAVMKALRECIASRTAAV